ncbi:tetratricopeptide repeat protein [Flavobacterium sp.]
MNEELYIVFENYLKNEMSHKQRSEFENQLQNDADMRKKFDRYKESHQLSSTQSSSDAVDLKKKPETISKKSSPDTKVKSKAFAFKPWHYAVAAALIVALAIWAMSYGNPEYDDFDQHEEAAFLERGSSDKAKIAAQKFFNARYYKKAIYAFEGIEDLTDPELQYFYAIALIETGHYKYAKLYLDNLRAGASVYKNKATWYLALMNLKQNKVVQCKRYLNEIPADGEDYEKAQKLLKDLD